MSHLYNRIFLVLSVSSFALAHAKSPSQDNQSTHDIMEYKKSIITALSEAPSACIPVLIDSNHQLLSPALRSFRTTSTNNVNTLQNLTATLHLKYDCPNTSVSENNAKSFCSTNITPIFAKDINPNGYMISRPGDYCLAQDVAFDPSAPGLSAIVINSSNVRINLNNKTLSKAGTQTGITGILVNGQSSVSIDGGTITDFNQYGIKVNPQSSYIQLNNLTVLGCGANQTVGGGIGISSAPNQITHDIIVDHVTASNNIWIGLTLAGVQNATITRSIFNNTQGATVPALSGTQAWGALAASLLTGVPSTDISFIDCQANGNTSQAGTVGIECLSVPTLLPYNTNLSYIRCTANNNVGGNGQQYADQANEGEGLVFVGAQNFVVKDCIANNNHNLAAAPSGTPGLYASTGFGILACIGGRIENCVADNNTGNGDVSTGFRVFRSSQVSVSRCVATNNNNNAKNGEAWGFTTDTNIGYIPGLFTPLQNTNCIFDTCTAQANLAANGLGGGFKFVSQINSILTHSLSLGNAIGILVSNPACCATSTCSTHDTACTGNTCCPATHNIISNNNVIGNSQSGIVDQTTPAANNAYTANEARSNGPAGSNYVGLPAGTPIRTWTIPGAPSRTDNNGILDPQLDNLDIRP